MGAGFSSRRRGWARRGLILAGLASLAGVDVGVSAQTAAADDDAPPSRVEIADKASPRARRAIFDVERLTMEAKNGALAVVVRFRRPLVEGTFECVHLYIDCDNNPATGLNGADLWVREGVGSRYQRTSASPPADGVPAPITLLRPSWSERTKNVRRDGDAGVSWLHSGGRGSGGRGLKCPVVNDRDVSFVVPLSLLASHGLRYNRSIRAYVEAEGGISEHPLFLEYVCADEGTPIAADGFDTDWSGQPRVEDATGELHPDADEIDIASLAVDHDAAHLHALVRLAASGFREPEHDGDVDDQDRVTVALEPLAIGGRYMDYVEETVTTLRASKHAGAGRKLVEFSIPRVPAQTAFRVVAWSDAIRVDRVPDFGWVDVGIPPEALRGR